MIKREEVHSLVSNLHEYSLLEVKLHDKDPFKAIWEMVERSDFVTTLYINKRLVAAGGVVKGSLITNHGVAWALMTNEAQEVPFQFIRESRAQLIEAKARYGMIECFANIKFPTTEKWMRLLRFERVKLYRTNGETYAHMLYRGP